MTAHARPDERGQRVSDEVSELDDLIDDLLDARAEIACLRAELGTALRDGWIAGRDAAAEVAIQDRRSELARDCSYVPEWQRHAECIAKTIRALAPPTEGQADD